MHSDNSRSPSPIAGPSAAGTKRRREPSASAEDAPAAQRPRVTNDVPQAPDARTRLAEECARFTQALRPLVDEFNATPEDQAALRGIVMRQLMTPTLMGLLRQPQPAASAPVPTGGSAIPASVQQGAQEEQPQVAPPALGEATRTQALQLPAPQRPTQQQVLVRQAIVQHQVTQQRTMMQQQMMLHQQAMMRHRQAQTPQRAQAQQLALAQGRALPQARAQQLAAQAQQQPQAQAVARVQQQAPAHPQVQAQGQAPVQARPQQEAQQQAQAQAQQQAEARREAQARAQILQQTYEEGRALVPADQWEEFRAGLEALVSKGAGAIVTKALVEGLLELPLQKWTAKVNAVAPFVQEGKAAPAPYHMLFFVAIEAPALVSAVAAPRILSALKALSPEARLARLETLQTLADSGIALRNHVVYHLLTLGAERLEDVLAQILTAVVEGQSAAPHDILVDCVCFLPWAYDSLAEPSDNPQDIRFSYENALTEHPAYKDVRQQATAGGVPLWPWQILGLCLLDQHACQLSLLAAKSKMQSQHKALQPAHIWDVILHAPQVVGGLDQEVMAAIAKMNAGERVTFLKDIAACLSPTTQRVAAQINAIASLPRDERNLFFELHTLLRELEVGVRPSLDARLWLQKNRWVLTEIMEMPQARRDANIVMAIIPLIDLTKQNMINPAWNIPRNDYDRLTPELSAALAPLSDAALADLATQTRPLLKALMQSNQPIRAIEALIATPDDERPQRIQRLTTMCDKWSMTRGTLMRTDSVLQVALMRSPDASRDWFNAAVRLTKGVLPGHSLQALLDLLRDCPLNDAQSFMDDAFIAVGARTRGSLRFEIAEVLYAVNDSRRAAASLINDLGRRSGQLRLAMAKLVVALDVEGRQRMPAIAHRLVGGWSPEDVSLLVDLLDGVDVKDRAELLERLSRLRPWQQQHDAIMQFVQQRLAPDRLPLIELVSPLLNGTHSTDRVLSFATHIYWVPLDERQAFIDLCMPLLDGDYDARAIAEKTYQVARASVADRPRVLAQQLTRPQLENVHEAGQDGRTLASIVWLRNHVDGPFLESKEAVEVAITLCEGGGEFGRDADRAAFAEQVRGGKTERENALRTLRGDYVDGADNALALSHNQQIGLKTFGTIGLGDALALIMRAIERYESSEGDAATQATRGDMWLHLFKELAFCNDEGDATRNVPIHRVCGRGILRHLMCVPQGHFTGVHVDDIPTPEQFLTAQSRAFFMESETFPSGGRVAESDPTAEDLGTFYRNTLALGADALGEENAGDRATLMEHLRAYLASEYDWTP